MWPRLLQAVGEGPQFEDGHAPNNLQRFYAYLAATPGSTWTIPANKHPEKWVNKKGTVAMLACFFRHLSSSSF